MGEDVGVFQGAFKVTEGLLDEFGERRVRDTPISENTIVGMGVGSAMGGPAPGGRADDGQLRAAGLRPDHQPRRRDPVHVQRPGDGADGRPHARRRRPPARPDPLAQLRGDVPPDPGAPRRLPLDARRRQGPAEGGDPRRQPGDLHRARDALRGPRRGPRGRRPRRQLRRGGDPARGHRRDHRRDSCGWRTPPSRRRRRSPPSTASRPR